MMPGVVYQEISDAIVDGFDHESLSHAVRSLMNVRLDIVTGSAKFGYAVSELVEWADMAGRDVELINAVAKAQPGNAKIQAIYKKYGLVIPTIVQEAGNAAINAPADASESGLERIVSPHLSFADFGVWRERMTRVEGQVCLITIQGQPQGTGFLVGPDAVLTNHHVMEPAIREDQSAGRFQCVFDFKILSNNVKSSTPIGLHATDWLLDSTPCTDSERRGKPDADVPTSANLDYALIRLAEPVGAKPWAVNPAPDVESPLRGWVRVPSGRPAFNSPMGVIIAQHPSGWPLKLAVDTRAIDQGGRHWLNSNETRVRYATNTLGGSSGSPVFDLEWNLIALHHYGDPDWNSQPAAYNQGIPIHAIRARLDSQGKLGALGD